MVGFICFENFHLDDIADFEGSDAFPAEMKVGFGIWPGGETADGIEKIGSDVVRTGGNELVI